MRYHTWRISTPASQFFHAVAMRGIIWMRLRSSAVNVVPPRNLSLVQTNHLIRCMPQGEVGPTGECFSCNEEQ